MSAFYLIRQIFLAFRLVLAHDHKCQVLANNQSDDGRINDVINISFVCVLLFYTEKFHFAVRLFINRSPQ